MGAETTEEVPPLSEIDKLVLELLKKNVPLILGWDGELGVFMIADYIEEPEEGSERPAPRIEYQISDGLPGDRTSSEDYYTFEEAQKAFDEFCDFQRKKIEARRKR